MAAIERDDLYAALGVSPNAEADAIKSAYRALARENHPDLSSKSDAGRVFQRLTEAYAVLSSPSRRAAYDHIRRAAEHGRTPGAPKPLRCSECGKTTAQPKILTFHSVTSLVVWSRRIRIEGIYCVACARRTALKASAEAFAKGWWAPFGPFLTVAAILRNALAGSRAGESDQRLLLFNAEAFLAQDNTPLAYALASHVSASAQGPLHGEAARLLAAARSKGPTHESLRLRDPWRLQAGDLAAHSLMAAGPPAALLIAVLL